MFLKTRDAFSIPKPLSSEGSFHFRNEKMHSRNWDCLDKCGWSLGVMRVRVSVWDQLCANLPVP
jgi:hypothetical protein